MSIQALLICLTLLPGSTNAADDAKPLWVVVSREQFVEALQPLVEKRRRDGFETVVSTESVSRTLKSSPRRPGYLLLVGDYQEGLEAESWHLAPKQRKLYRWREEQAETFASDTAWGDVDRDLFPDMAVGRIPARSASDVAIVVGKIIEFERQEPSVRDLQLLVWSGLAMYGPTMDRMASGLVLPSIQNNGPKWISPWIIIGDKSQPFCGWPPDQPSLFLRKMQEGGICHAFIGHANEYYCTSMFHGEKTIAFSAPTAHSKLADGPPTPPLILLACQAGNFAYHDRCMAESFLLRPYGPVAVIGATTESHPLPNYFAGQAMLKALGGKNKRLGDIWLEVEGHALTDRNILIEKMLHEVEGKLGKTINEEKLRRDHVLMDALLGDPATKLRLPDPLTATVTRQADGWHWKVQRPNGATRLHVGLRVFGRHLPQPVPDSGREAANSTLQTANATLAFEPLSIPDDTWEGTIDREGLVRFVAVGGSEIYATTVELREE